MSAWSTTSTTLPTCASRGSATGSSTGSPSTTRGYVWAPGVAGVWEGRRRGPGWTPPNGCRCVFQSVAVEGYETGEHAPGLRLKGSGAYRTAHHIIKVSLRFASPGSSKKNQQKKHLTFHSMHLASIHQIQSGPAPRSSDFVIYFSCLLHRHMLKSGTPMTPNGEANRKVRR